MKVGDSIMWAEKFTMLLKPLFYRKWRFYVLYKLRVHMSTRISVEDIRAEEGYWKAYFLLFRLANFHELALEISFSSFNIWRLLSVISLRLNWVTGYSSSFFVLVLFHFAINCYIMFSIIMKINSLFLCSIFLIFSFLFSPLQTPSWPVHPTLITAFLSSSKSCLTMPLSKLNLILSIFLYGCSTIGWESDSFRRKRYHAMNGRKGAALMFRAEGISFLVERDAGTTEPYYYVALADFGRALVVDTHGS